MKVIRHDTITVNNEVKEGDFEKFMRKEFLPFFRAQYKGPTRSSIADLKGQSLLKATEDGRNYLWITEWDGSSESVRGSSFEHTRMNKIEATEAMLEKLKAFGKRSAERVFDQVVIR